MHPSNTHKVLTFLSPISKNIDKIHSLSGLESTDLALLEGLAAFAMFLTRRMRVKNKGGNLALTVNKLQTTAAVLFSIPHTHKVQ